MTVRYSGDILSGRAQYTVFCAADKLPLLPLEVTAALSEMKELQPTGEVIVNRYSHTVHRIDAFFNWLVFLQQNLPNISR